ncbi:Uncharacterised protein [uncultured archaeon]|nr:Uncharacterised protein [uncultured archaeon]
MNSLASKSPIVEGIIIRILNTYPIQLETKEKHVLDADLVPKIHEKIIARENLQESMIHAEEVSQVKPLQLQVSNKIISLQPQEPPKPSEKPWETFKKILPMLQDPFVSYIECKGPNQPLSVIKNGRTQVTSTFMDRGEIDEYLKYLSEKTRVPLVEGVFNVRVDDYTINAIISNSIEPSFIIKKNLSGAMAYPR